jgi:hypothetical protein
MFDKIDVCKLNIYFFNKIIFNQSIHPSINLYILTNV